MQPDDRVRLLHMIEAAETVSQFVADRRREDLDCDRMLLFAVLRGIEVMGEAASKVSLRLRESSPAVPWGAIVGMRNRLIHGYFEINTEVVWNTATQEIPSLLAELRTLVQGPS
ncbi:MAG: DUF86 domain-containing protein [Deltaproteobacteria bacterium]|nr:DUF86 domain-containing protein [Deltaproteobacteria bacterium]